MKKRALLGSFLIIGLLIVLTGCVFKGEQSLTEMDPPKDADATKEANYVEDVEDVSEGAGAGDESSESSADKQNGEENGTNETVERQLYLLDSNGMVVPQTIALPKDESKAVASQVLEYLIKDGPVTELLPNGFSAVLPAGTQILGLNLKEDGSLIVDVSKEFKEYQPENERKILESMTYTLTQFENVEKIQLRINGYDQTEMPVNGTPIGKGYSRANGINIYEKDTVDLMDSEAVTLYYPAQQNDTFYNVPITQHVKAEGDMYQSIVQALVDGPSFELNLLNVFNSGTSLSQEPTYKDGVVALTFNEAVLNNVDKASISDKVMKTLVLTLTDQPGVEAVDVKVENIDQVYNENGEAYSEPVTRDTFVPTGEM
ncbi:GerMN domain-containing protein [Aquibacillus sp. 3ASR75-11]|uniref:GerMN domain-containing protein n=1 Tax=Terrihalobacillus insolitus TaxID=2950438 RepID=A0A9X3WQG2_9BACI|nr:GerMN domain-containing protein [Terrihalobacillus insolitus]MDC3412569.1 GerMN domain-containing protein [Terrihalobacillus insolitus]MDC3423920.1 GerMN domain-containing protein [Terrihalobacillus insolitus]